MVERERETRVRVSEILSVTVAHINKMSSFSFCNCPSQTAELAIFFFQFRLLDLFVVGSKNLLSHTLRTGRARTHFIEQKRRRDVVRISRRQPASRPSHQLVPLQHPCRLHLRQQQPWPRGGCLVRRVIRHPRQRGICLISRRRQVRHKLRHGVSVAHFSEPNGSRRHNKQQHLRKQQQRGCCCCRGRKH